MKYIEDIISNKIADNISYEVSKKTTNYIGMMIGCYALSEVCIKAHLNYRNTAQQVINNLKNGRTL